MTETPAPTTTVPLQPERVVTPPRTGSLMRLLTDAAADWATSKELHDRVSAVRECNYATVVVCCAQLVERGVLEIRKMEHTRRACRVEYRADPRAAKAEEN
jgi:predicted transcriptional regulator